MAATRIFRPVRPSASAVSSSSSSPSSAATFRCMGKTELNSKNGERLNTSGNGERRQTVAVKAAAAPETLEMETGELDLGSMLANLAFRFRSVVGKTRIRKRQIQKFIEKVFD